MKTRHSDDFRSTDQLGQTVRPSDSAQVKTFGAMTRVGRWKSKPNAFSIATKNVFPSFVSSSLCLSLNGTLVVPLYLIDGFRPAPQARQLTTPKKAGPAPPETRLFTSEQEKNGMLLTNKQMIFISHVLNESFFAEICLFLFDRGTTFISSCCFLAHDRSVESMHDIVLADLTYAVQQHRLLGNIKYCKVFSLVTAAGRLAASKD